MTASVASRRTLGDARDTEVEDLHASFARDEQVLRFEVAVDDPAIVRRGQACGDIGSQPDRARRRERRAGEQRAERRAFEQFVDDVRRTIVLARVVNDDDVRMVQRPRGASFLLETTEPIRIGRKRRRENLDGDVAAEAFVLGAIHLAHAAFPERGEHFIATETSACRQASQSDGTGLRLDFA